MVCVHGGEEERAVSHWNYRVVRRQNVSPTASSPAEYAYTIHEVHYDDDGQIKCWSESGYAPFGESVSELVRVLGKMVEAAGKPLLREEHLPGWVK